MKKTSIFFTAAIFTITMVLSLPAYAAGDTISGNSCDDCTVIINSSSSSRRRLNIQTFSNVRVRTHVTQNTGFNSIIAGEDNVNPIIVSGNASSSIQQIIRVGNVTLNFTGSPPIFPE